MKRGCKIMDKYIKYRTKKVWKEGMGETCKEGRKTKSENKKK